MRFLILATTIAGLVASAPQAQAIGCFSGAVAGGVAGHYAGHHAVLGAIGGCVVGHHLAVEQKRKRQQQSVHQPVQPATSPAQPVTTQPAQ
jgi:hypothetical protein